MTDPIQKIEKMRQHEAVKMELFFDIFEDRFTEITDAMRDLKAGQERIAEMEDRLLKKEQLAKKLQVSVSTISKLQTEGLPVIQCLKAVRFDYRDVVEWLKDHVNKKNGKQIAARGSIAVRTQSSSNGKSQMEAQNGSI